MGGKIGRRLIHSRGLGLRRGERHGKWRVNSILVLAALEPSLAPVRTVGTFSLITALRTSVNGIVVSKFSYHEQQ